MVASGNFPANICWSWRRLPLRHVLKTSSRHVFNTSSTSLQRNNFTSSETSWRRLEGILLEPWRRLQDVLRDKKIVTLKTCRSRLKEMPWRRLEEMFWRCLEDMSRTRHEDVMETNKILMGIYVSSKAKCVSNKSIFHKSIFDNSKANPNALIRTK